MKEEDNKIWISVPVKKKRYYSEDVIKSLIQDGELVFKNGFNFVQVNILENQHFFKEFIKLIQQDIKKYNKLKEEATKKKGEKLT